MLRASHNDCHPNDSLQIARRLTCTRLAITPPCPARALVAATDLPPADTRLKLDLTGRDPDEGMTQVAYNKGSAFLRMLELAVGRERFDAYLRSYFDRHAFQSMTTTKLVEDLKQNLLAKNPDPSEEEVRFWLAGNLCRCTGYDKIVRAVMATASMEFVSTRTETEALLLEGKLIKQWRPKYNTDFTDDKRFLLVRLNLDAALPRFALTRFSA